MRKVIKKIIPRLLLKKIRRVSSINQLKDNYRKDMNRYANYSFDLSKHKTKRHMESDLIFFYHKIEKGLSLRKPRLGFGKEIINHLLDILNEYAAEYGWDSTAQVALNTLYSYYEFNKKHGLILDDLLSEINRLTKYSTKTRNITIGGTTTIYKNDIENARVNFKDFAKSRYSLRTFSPGDISMSVIREAVEIAQKTPSVCNRQSSKVYVFEGDFKRKVLKHQNGNAGFGDDADKVLIITSDLMDFRGPKERNQAFIDGGMFSMSLIYALHSLGVGTCALNLSLNYNDELKLKEVAQIKDSEVTIMMMALGRFPDKFEVADSPRRNINDVLLKNSN